MGLACPSCNSIALFQRWLVTGLKSDGGSDVNCQVLILLAARLRAQGLFPRSNCPELRESMIALYLRDTPKTGRLALVLFEAVAGARKPFSSMMWLTREILV